MKNKHKYILLPGLVVALMLILVALFVQNGEGAKAPESRVLSTENTLRTHARDTNVDIDEAMVYGYGVWTLSFFDLQNLFIINRAEIKTHEAPYGRGIQYSIVIRKFASELTKEDEESLHWVISYLLKENTKYVLARNPSISYVAIQVLYPDLWVQGFARVTEGHGYLYVAKRNDLLAFLEMEDDTLDWAGAARRGTIELVDSTILRDLMDKNFENKRKQTEKGFEFPK